MPGKSKPAGAGKYLLFDDKFIEAAQGVSLKLGRPVLDDGPVLMPDKPWEAGGLRGDSNMSIMEDEGGYKLWYAVQGERNAETENELRKKLSKAEISGMDKKMLADYLTRSTYMLCYAFSNDGVRWHKPELGVIRHKGSRKNNIVMIARLGCTVFKDPSAPLSERFKLIYGAGPCLEHINMSDNSSPGKIYQGIYGAYSRDGVHWKPCPGPIMPWYTDTTNVCYWDDEKKKYAAFVRWNEGMIYKNGRTYSREHGRIAYRAVGRAESGDFRSFPAPVNVHEPEPKERHPFKSGMDYYNSAAVKYPFCPGSYFLFVSDFYHDTDLLDVHLATSRDGVNYTHWKEPFVSLGMEGRFDSGCIYMASGMIGRGDEVWMYYAGYSTGHGKAAGKAGTRVSGAGRARIRMDGFVARDFSRSGGSMTTAPLEVSGDSMTLNMDGGAAGSLKVELLDGSGSPAAGFTLRECENLRGNSVEKVVAWNGKSGLAALRGKKAKLRFRGKSVKLYSFKFNP